MPLGKETTLQSEDYTSFCISWQESYVDESRGLFLPDYIDLTDVYVLVSCENTVTEVIPAGVQ